MGGIAEHRDAAERPSSNRIAIDQRKFVDVRRLLDQGGQVEPGEFPIAECSQDLFFGNKPVPVFGWGGPVRHRLLANPVNQTLAAWPPADGIDDDALVKMAGDDHGLAIEERLGLNRRPPQHLLGEARRAFHRIELMPDGGIDAVGADKDVRLVDLLRSGLTISEADAHTVTNLLKSGELQSASDVSVPDAVADCAKQEKLKLAAMNRILRPVVPGCEAPAVGMD